MIRISLAVGGRWVRVHGDDGLGFLGGTESCQNLNDAVWILLGLFITSSPLQGNDCERSDSPALSGGIGFRGGLIT